MALLCVMGLRFMGMYYALLALAQLNIDLRKGGRDYARLEEILVSLLYQR